MIYLDFETRGIVDLIKLGATRYAMDPLTQVLCMSWLFDDQPSESPDDVPLWHRRHPWCDQSERPDELIERIASGELVEAHNARFEFLIWNECLLREYPEFGDVKIKLEQLRCSAAKASCVSLPRSLGEACIAVNLPIRKDTDGGRLINKLSKPMRRKKGQTGVVWCEEEIEHRRNWRYNQQDVRAERGLSEFCPEMSDRELDYWRMDFRMSERGIQLNTEDASEAIKICERETLRLNAEMYEITGGRVEGGSKRIPFRKWANEQLKLLDGDPLPDTRADTLSFALYGVPTKAGDDAKAAAKGPTEQKWNDWGDAGKPIYRAMEICLEVNRSSVAKYRQMVGSVCPDGRLHDIMLYNGADRTGRWSGKGVQPHNFVRGYTKDMPEIWNVLRKYADSDFIELVTGDLMLPAMAKACRGALTASPGKELYAADFNAIEARKLAWMAGCAPLLRLFQTGGDPYCDMASGIYKRAITKADKTERQLGKKAILGLGYAMGWEKFQATVWNDEGIWLDDEFCQDIVKIYRKEKYPEIPKFWKATNDAAISASEARDGVEFFAGGIEAEYTLNEDDQAWAISIGRLRTAESRRLGIPRNKYPDEHNWQEDEGVRRDVYGAAAELVFCRTMGYEWPAHVNVFKSEPDVRGGGIDWEIQYASDPTYGLIIRPDQNRADRTYALVRAVSNTMNVSKPFDFRFTIVGSWKGSNPVKESWRNARTGNNIRVPTELLTRFAASSPGFITYFKKGPFLHCRLPSGRLLAYLYPEVHTKVSYRFSAKNARGKDCIVMFPAKVGVPMSRVLRHAEQLAKKQGKELTSDPPESFCSPHLSFMGRDTYTHQWKRCGTHGGTLVENADQASSRDLLAESMFRVDQTDDFDLLLSIHDEVVAEAPIGTATLKEFEDMMAIVPWWAPGMPIGAEGWIGPRLRK